MKEIGHFINGKEVKGTSGRTTEIFNPSTGEVQALVALASRDELDQAVSLSQEAQPKWANTNPQRRARVIMRFIELSYSKKIRLFGSHLASATVAASENQCGN